MTPADFNAAVNRLRIGPQTIVDVWTTLRNYQGTIQIAGGGTLISLTDSTARVLLIELEKVECIAAKAHT